jgi:hypothetical protein
LRASEPKIRLKTTSVLGSAKTGSMGDPDLSPIPEGCSRKLYRTRVPAEVAHTPGPFLLKPRMRT